MDSTTIITSIGIFFTVMFLSAYAEYLTRPEPTKDLTINCVEVEPTKPDVKTYKCQIAGE